MSCWAHRSRCSSCAVWRSTPRFEPARKPFRWCCCHTAPAAALSSSAGWAGRLRRGYVVAAVNHHGNTSREPYLPHGFLLWWERAKDLTAVPVHVVVTEGDAETPPRLNGCRYAQLIANAELTHIEGPAGHYVFLAEATAAGRKALPELCADDPTVDRRALHERVAALAGTCFDEALVNGPANQSARA